MAPKSRGVSRREQIIETAQRLYNEQGYGAVTTAALAAHCGIAEGNLWYHFKTRRALLEAIAERFAAAIERRLMLHPSGCDPVGDYAALAGCIMAELRDFRFLYRDQHAYGEHVEPIASHVRSWLQGTFAQVEAHFAALVDAGMLDWERARLPDLAINATILIRYGLEHERELGEPTGEGTGAVARALQRHLTLFEHRLAPAAAIRLRAAVDAIGAETQAA